MARGPYPTLTHTKSEVRRAGEMLRGHIVWSKDSADDALWAFDTAYNWRDSHIQYMDIAHAELRRKLKVLQLVGTLTAARMKRMRSIRRKLREISSDLNQMQDLGGCRAILATPKDVDTLVASYRADSRLQLREKDYIGRPKPGGYRSHHLVMQYAPGHEPPNYAGQRIELQVRTRLQHSWATAVEAVGTFLREDLKGGNGNADWLRLFELMALEVASEESVIQRDDDRRCEIIALNKKLNALGKLGTWADAVKFTENLTKNPHGAPHYFLITYDNKERTVKVRPYFGAIESARSYELAENTEAGSGDRYDTVLVESNRVSDLQAAYPNYFGDVQLFKMCLERAVHGEVTPAFTHEPVPVRTPPAKERAVDPRWVQRTSPQWRWDPNYVPPRSKKTAPQAPKKGDRE